MPRVAATTSTPRPSASETRPPWSTREKRSRASASVPKRCAGSGGRSMTSLSAAGTAVGS